MIDGAGLDGNVNGNLRGEGKIGITGQADLGGAELDAKEALLEVDGLDVLGEEDVDDDPGKGLAAKFGDMLLDGAIVGEGGIAELDFGNFEIGAFDRELLNIAVAERVVHDFLLESDVEFAGGDEFLDGFGGGVDYVARFGKGAVVKGKLGANGGGELGIAEPGDVIKENGQTRGLLDGEIERKLFVLGAEAVFDVAEESGGDEAVGGGLQIAAVHLRIQLQAGESDELVLGELGEAVNGNLAEHGRGGVRRLRGDEGRQRECGKKQSRRTPEPGPKHEIHFSGKEE